MAQGQPRSLQVRVLVLQPSDARAKWSATDLRNATRSAITYWEQVTGGAYKFTAAAPRVAKTTRLTRCNYQADKAAAQRLFKLGRTAPGTLYVVGNTANTCTTLQGQGELNGAWVMIGKPQAGVVAHELGHNLGLLHAGAANCPTSDGRFGLAIPDARCRITEYGDSDDIMGNNFDVNLSRVGLSSASMSKLGLATAEPVVQPQQYSLAPLETRRKFLSIETEYGVVLVEYSVGHKGTLFGEANDHTVQLRLVPTRAPLTKRNDSVQIWAFRDPGSSGDVDGPYLYSGERFDIPGSTWRLAIGAMDRTGVDLALTKTSTPAAPAPISPGSVVRESGNLRFVHEFTSTSSGYVFYAQSLSGPRIIGSTRGPSGSWSIPDALASSVVGVASVDRSGAVSAIAWSSRA